MNKAVSYFVAAAFAASMVPAYAYADERSDLENLRSTTFELINLLVEQGILSRTKADVLIREANKRATDAKAKPPNAAVESKVVRVPYVPQTVRDQIRDEIKQEIVAEAKAERWGNPGALPEWMDRIAFEGDMRMRYQGDRFQKDNFPPFVFQAAGQDISNTTEDRDRLRLRARLGVRLKLADWLSGGLRLTTGNTGDPVSTNQTLGNSYNKYSVVLDQAYVKADPYEWMSISGGRIPNPWFSTDMVWDEDVNFDGVAVTFKPRINDSLQGFLTLGAFPLQEIADGPQTLAKDKWLSGAQVGLTWLLPQNSRFKVGLALYDYKNIEGIRNSAASPNAYDLTAPQFRQKGNSLYDITATGTGTTFGLTAGYREFNLTAAYDIARFDPVHVVLTGDYVKNIGYDAADIRQRTGLAAPDPETTGYYARMMVGMPQLRSRGDWQSFVGYKYLERDAVLDAFTDSDFHLGGTNAKGFILGGSYGIGNNSWVTLRWMSSTQISGPPLAIDVMNLEFKVRF